MAPSSPRWPLLIVLVAVVAVYQSVAGFGFVWDDHLLIQGNQLLATPANLLDFLRSDLWAGTPDPDAEPGYYRPLLVMDLAITRALGGPGPGVYHVHSLLWHLLAVVGVFQLLRVLVDVPWAAATGTAVFALHPVQVEAISFISARNDLMATGLLVWALVLLSRDRPSNRVLAGGALLALGALLSKESVLLAPLLLAFICRARGPGWGRLRPHLALLGAMGAGLGLRLLAGVGTPAQADMAHLWGALGPTLAHTADRLVWPLDLAPMVHLGWPPPMPWVGAGVGLVLLLLLLIIGRRRAGLGLGFALLGLAPAMAGVAHTGIIVDRYLYLPMVGLALMVAACTARAPRRHVLFALVSATSLLLTAAHLPTWDTDQTLWRSAMDRAPSGYAAGAYARWLEDEGKLEQAAAYYRQAVMPPRPFATACYNITRIHLALGRPDMAVTAGQAALEAGCEASPELVAPMALAMALTGDWEAAESTARRVGVDPTGQAVLVRLAAAARRGDLAPLRKEMEAAGAPDSERLLDQVARVIAFSGEPREAAALRAAAAGN